MYIKCLLSSWHSGSGEPPLNTTNSTQRLNKGKWTIPPDDCNVCIVQNTFEVNYPLVLTNLCSYYFTWVETSMECLCSNWKIFQIYISTTQFKLQKISEDYINWSKGLLSFYNFKSILVSASCGASQ